MAVTTIQNITRAPIVLLALAEAVILYTAVYVASLALCAGGNTCEHIIDATSPHALIISAVMITSLMAMGLYELHQRMFFREVVLRLSVGIMAGTLILVGAYVAISPTTVSEVIVCLAAVYAFPALVLLRYFFLQNIDQNIFRRKTLVYGSGTRAASITSLRRRADRRGFRIVGQVPEVTEGRSVLDIALETGADEIVIAMDDRRKRLPVDDLLHCRLRGIEVIDIIEFLERETEKIRIDLVSPGWFIFAEGFRQNKLTLFAKRVTDVALSATALLAGWPILLFAALAIKLEDGWSSPVFYRQRRIGQHGLPFNLLKLRTMVVDAESDGRAVWAAHNDARITKAGRWMRKMRIDELPQIVNVLRGEMSIVGPRPERPEFVGDFANCIEYYSERHSVKPGITGWAQLRYAYGASQYDACEKLQYDLYYVKNHSLLLDLLIILQTAEVVLWGKGAR